MPSLKKGLLNGRNMTQWIVFAVSGGKMLKNLLSMERHVETFYDEGKKAEVVVACTYCGPGGERL